VEDTIFLVAHYAVVGVLVAAVPLGSLALFVLLGDDESPQERRERELARLLAEQELYGGERCLCCRAEVEPDWLSCPVCTTKLRSRCQCGTLLKLHWSACPSCGAGLQPPLDQVVDDVRAAAA
jgi:hypothetical protein